MESDVRYSFLNTLDHLPCDMIRTLWTIQSIDMQLQALKSNDDHKEHVERQRFLSQESLHEAESLEQLLQQHIVDLKFQIGELRDIREVKQRYNEHVRKLPPPETVVPLPPPPKKNKTRGKTKKPLKVRINFSKQETRREQGQELFCFCRDISYGPMVACDNPSCPIEWFHYACVGLLKAPRNNAKWYCSTKCRNTASKKRKGEIT